MKNTIPPYIDNIKTTLSNKLHYIIKKNIANPYFAVTDLATDLSLSERQLRRRCKELTDLSPRQLIIEFRLSYAKQILKNNDRCITIKEIAEQTGFANASYFSRLFIQRFGHRPSEYL